MINPNRFGPVHDEYARLKTKLSVGRITRAQFEAALKTLVVQDAQGCYWTIHPVSGQWLLYDGDKWNPAMPPPSALSAMPAAPSESAGPPATPPERFLGMPQARPGTRLRYYAVSRIERRARPAPSRLLLVGILIAVVLLTLVAFVYWSRPAVNIVAATSAPARPAPATLALPPAAPALPPAAPARPAATPAPEGLLLPAMRSPFYESCRPAAAHTPPARPCGLTLAGGAEGVGARLAANW